MAPRLFERAPIGSENALLAALHQLALAMTAATEPAGICDAALSALGSATSADRAAVLIGDADGVIRFKAWRGLSAEYRHAVEGHSPWTIGERVATPFTIADALDEPSLARWRDTIRAEGVRGMAFLPLFVNGSVAGKFMLYADAPGTFSSRDMQIAETIGAHIGFALARLRASDALARSERKYRGVFDGTTDGILLVNGDGYYLDANEAMCRILRATRDRVIGAHFSRFIPRDLLTDAGDALEDLKLSAGFEGLFPVAALDGTIVQLDWKSRADIVPGVHMCVARDVTDLLRSETDALMLAKVSEVLGASLDFDATLGGVANLVVPHLADWCAIDVPAGDGGRRRVAFSAADPATAPIAEELDRQLPEDLSRTAGISHALATGRSELYADLSGDLSGVPPDYRALLERVGLRSVIIAPLKVGARVLGTLTLASGPSGRRYTERDLRLLEEVARRAALAVDHARLYREARDANRLKDEFLATLSHELRTPLNAIVGWARILEQRWEEPATVRKGVEAIARNARAQELLVQDLLDVSRIVTGRIALEMQPTDVAAVLRAALEAIRLSAESKGVKVEIGTSGEAIVLGDAARLEQIAWNLLSNAVKFTPAGGVVTVELGVDGGHAWLCVRDTGEGISAEFLPHVFERFRQADASSTRAHGGLGLGLTIVHHLVTLHGGSVTAESDGPGRGSVFTVRLPLAQLAAP